MTVDATARIRADQKRLRGDLAQAEKLFKQSFAKIGGGIKTALSTALSPLGVGLGVAGLAAVGREVLQFEDVLGRLEIQSGMSRKETDRLRETIHALSKSSAISANDVLAGANALVTMMGPVENLEELLGVLTETMLGSGDSAESVAGLMFAMRNSFGITEAKDYKQALSAIIEAGNQGAATMAEVSDALRSVSASFVEFGVKSGPNAVAELSAAMQILLRGFSSAPEAATGLQSLMTALIKQKDDLAAMGIEVFDASGNLRDLNDLFRELGRLNLDQLVKVLGRVEAAKAAQTMGKHIDDYDKMTEAAQRSNAVETQAARRREQAAFRIQKAFNDARAAIAEAMTPERLEKFGDLMGKAADILGTMVEHADELLAAFIAWKALNLAVEFAAVAKHLRSAAIAAGALRAAGAAGGAAGAAGGIAGAAGAGGGALAAGGGALAGGASLLAAGGAVVAAGAAGVAIGRMLDSWLGISESVGKMDAEVRQTSLTGGYLTGTVTPQMRQRSASAGVGELVNILGGIAGLRAPEGLFGPSRKDIAQQDILLGEAGRRGWFDDSGTAPSFEKIRSSLHAQGGGLLGMYNEPAQRILEEIREVLKMREEATERETKVNVVITVDKQGILKVVQETAEEERRRTPFRGARAF